jgi:hypothetical protein
LLNYHHYKYFSVLAMDDKENDMYGFCIGKSVSPCGSKPLSALSVTKVMFKSTELNMDTSKHFRDIRVEAVGVSEKALICNRLGILEEQFTEDMAICGKHRFSLGVSYRPPRKCMHPNPHHKSKPKGSSLKPCSLNVGKSISKKFCRNFIIGDRLCNVCLRSEYQSQSHNQIIPSEEEREILFIAEEETSERRLRKRNKCLSELYVSRDESISSHSDFQSDPNWADNDLAVVIPSPKRQCLNASFNEHLNDLNLPPLSILQSPIENVSARHKRRLRKNFQKYIETCTDTFMKGTSTRSADEFMVQIAKPVFSKLAGSCTYSPDSITPQLLEVYSKGNRKVQNIVLSIVAFDYTQDYICRMFNCSKRQIETARQIKKSCNILLQPSEKKQPALRRMTAERIQHFLHFLFDRNYLQDNAYLTSTIKLSSGKKIEVPKVILVIRKRQMITMYQQYCEELNYDPLSERVCYNIVNAMKGKQKKCLQGLDSYIADGISGLDQLVSICPDIELQRRVKAVQNHLKISYLSHLECDNDPRHCVQFALSDQKNKPHYTGVCDHKSHEVHCPECDQIFSLFSKVKSSLEAENTITEESLLVIDKAQESTLKWAQHVVRGYQQHKSKEKAMEQVMMDSSCIVIISDWSMKWLPLRHRESQSDWFGKRGISLHIDVVFLKSDEHDGQLQKYTYLTVIDETKQDSVAVSACYQQVLKDVKVSFPTKKKVIIRSDNAGCYHSLRSVLARRKISEEMGMELIAYHFCEAQRGKDQADRESALIKAKLRSAIDSGKDILSGNDIIEALKCDVAIRNLKASLLVINDGSIHVTDDIPDFISLHTVHFHKNSLTAWKYFEVGTGKLLKCPSTDVSLSVNILLPFPLLFGKGRPPFSHRSRGIQPSASLDYICPEVACGEVFDTEFELCNHVTCGNHTFAPLSSMDFLKATVAQELLSPSLMTKTDQVHSGISSCLQECEIQGWALPCKRTVHRFTKEQLSFVRNLFIQGNVTKRKVSAAKAVELMADCFPPRQRLTRAQISSLFSRMASNKATTVEEYHVEEQNESEVTLPK